jgi:hypothetical protein
VGTETRKSRVRRVGCSDNEKVDLGSEDIGDEKTVILVIIVHKRSRIGSVSARNVE